MRGGIWWSMQMAMTIGGALGEKLKMFSITALNGSVLAVTMLENIDAALKVGQILLVLATIVFTVQQIWRLRIRLHNEKALRVILQEARRECKNAEEGRCPLQVRLETMELNKNS